MSACAIREEAVVTDTDQSRRKYMQQKPAKELVDVEAEELFGVAMCVVAIAEADALAVVGDDAGVADGDAVGVVGEISENLLRPAEGRFAVRSRASDSRIHSQRALCRHRSGFVVRLFAAALAPRHHRHHRLTGDHASTWRSHC